MREELTAEQKTVLDFAVSQAERGSVSGKRLRAQLGVTTNQIAQLAPRYLEAYAQEPRDHYSPTFEGLLASLKGIEVRHLLLGILRTLKAKFQEDPDFNRYTWPELKRFSELTIDDKDLPLTDFTIKLAGLADTSTTEGNPPVWAWYTPDNIESLLTGAKSGDLEDFIRAIRNQLADKRARRSSMQEWMKRDGSAFMPGEGEEQSSASIRAEPAGFLLDIEQKLRSLSGPGLADCYRQAISDLEDPGRLSFVGPATELRLVIVLALRSVASDSVLAAAGKTPGGEDAKYTMRDRAAFVFETKQRSAAKAKPALVALERIQGLDGLAKELYDGTNKGAHTTALDRHELRVLAQYCNALLLDLL